MNIKKYTYSEVQIFENLLTLKTFLHTKMIGIYCPEVQISLWFFSHP